MQIVTVKDLRDNLAQIIEETAIGGKRFTITKFGKKKAVILPISDIGTDTKKKKSVDFSKHPTFGIWKDREDMKDSAAWVEKQRKRWRNRLT